MWLWRQGPSRHLRVVSQGTAQHGALQSPELPEGGPLVTDTVSLKSALRYHSVKSRLNTGRERPVLGGMQAEELRWASKLFADSHLPFSGSQEGGGNPGATVLCKNLSASVWSPASSPDLALWLHLLRYGMVCSGEHWIKQQKLSDTSTPDSTELPLRRLSRVSNGVS